MANNKEVDKAIEAVINLASALGISENDLTGILEEAIVFNGANYSDKTIEIVEDLVTSPELDNEKPKT